MFAAHFSSLCAFRFYRKKLSYLSKSGAAFPRAPVALLPLRSHLANLPRILRAPPWSCVPPNSYTYIPPCIPAIAPAFSRVTVSIPRGRCRPCGAAPKKISVFEIVARFFLPSRRKQNRLGLRSAHKISMSVPQRPKKLLSPCCMVDPCDIDYFTAPHITWAVPVLRRRPQPSG